MIVSQIRQARWASMLILVLPLLLTLPVAQANASGPGGEGPKIGAALADTLAAPDQNGRARDFKSMARQRGLIILFTRSFDW
jgi:membrane protein involved in colicin uptake